MAITQDAKSAGGGRGRPARMMWIAGGLLGGLATATAATPGVHNIRDHGAAGDGRTPDTVAIQKAIDACSAAGGGQVRFPPGTFLSGTLHLRSNVTLQVDAGARLVGTTDLDRYQHYTPPAGTHELRAGNVTRKLNVSP